MFRYLKVSNKILEVLVQAASEMLKKDDADKESEITGRRMDN